MHLKALSTFNCKMSYHLVPTHPCCILQEGMMSKWHHYAWYWDSYRSDCYPCLDIGLSGIWGLWSARKWNETLVRGRKESKRISHSNYFYTTTALITSSDFGPTSPCSKRKRENLGYTALKEEGRRVNVHHVLPSTCPFINGEQNKELV